MERSKDDELDRIKQAEKKKRRLEKALATSAAIRSELEKKKQKKKEEQQRLDEEGAAIAEAVAMHVLGEDSDDSCKVMLESTNWFNPWSQTGNVGHLMGGRDVDYADQGLTKYSVEGMGWISNTYGLGCKLNEHAIGNWSMSPDILGRDQCAPYFDEAVRGTAGISAALMAAQAVSSLRIAE